MSTTTRLLAEELLSEIYGDWWSEVTTGAGSTTATVDTKLAQLSADDDFCVGWYVRKVAANGGVAGEIRRITAYAASTTTITHAAFTTAGVGNGLTYELHRINPTTKFNALNRAAEDAFPFLYSSIIDERLVVDNLLENPGFDEGFTDDWNSVGSPTIAAETTKIFHRLLGASAASSAKITAGGSAGQLTQAPTLYIPEVIGKTATFKMMCWADTATECRLRLDWNGTDIESGDYHTGDSQWRRLSVSGTIPTNATQVKAIVEVAANGVGYFDDGGECGLFIDNIYRYTVPSALKSVNFLSQQHNVNMPDGLYLPFGEFDVPIRGRHLRLEGTGLLTRPTTDAGTFEIGAPQTELLLAYAGRYMARQGFLRAGAQGRENQKEDLAFWQEEIDRMTLRRHPRYRRGFVKPAMSAEERRNWNTIPDQGTEYLIFETQRDPTILNA